MSDYQAPSFDFAATEAELNAMGKAAAKLLSSNSQLVIGAAIESLRNTKKRPGRWEIDDKRPLKTTLCHGTYVPNSAGKGYCLEGRLSFVWDIAPVKTKQTRFAIAGKASTKIEIHRRKGADRFTKVGEWRFEMGDVNAPGAFFHGQVSWPNHKSVDVPRLPSYLVTPIECLDFLLGELFQDDWPKLQFEKKNELAQWSSRQRARISGLLRAKSKLLENVSGMSPWIALKKWKPDNTDIMFG